MLAKTIEHNCYKVDFSVTQAGVVVSVMVPDRAGMFTPMAKVSVANNIFTMESANNLKQAPCIDFYVHIKAEHNVICTLQ
jgi:hypothetical protein